MKPDEFLGKRALVTGAASGIGRAVTRMIASHGGTVGCLDVDGDGLHETASQLADHATGQRIATAKVDVTDAVGVSRAIDELGFGTVDLLFNVAGIIMTKPLASCDVDDLERVMRINVGSIITMTSVAVPLMPRGGVIINTSSTSALHYATGSGIYGASKAAINHITKCLANELSESGIRVCAVGPGGVDTPMPRRLAAEMGVDPESTVKAAVAKSQLIPDLARPEEIAAAMGYLASEDARMCTGSTLWIDGGANVR